MQLSVNILNKEKETIGTFCFSLLARTINHQQLDAETFYLAYAKTIHPKTVEIRIDKVERFSLDDMLVKKTHIHQGNDKQWYICYPSKLSMKTALYTAIHWSMITMFHMLYQADVSYFESFDRWLIKYRETEPISAFNGFALWINEFNGWTAEVQVERSKMDMLKSIQARKLLCVLTSNHG